ncbi:WD40 domain containing protein [Pyrrhoderma noxium]|uniref:WD40 domain containing protein n=1 Tax=Pyrrhoderma noxium TaxID=2282107 RepID=A0A286UWD0_9AGAM|nr:WD40 domain containing protein [Pyrrhoderma noxium]
MMSAGASDGLQLSFESSLLLPTHATAVTFSSNGKVLAAGSDDGSVRIYHPPETKVKSALRALGGSISNLIFNDAEGNDLWIASGKSVLRFDLKDSKLIYNKSDNLFSKDIGIDDEDVVNQLALSANHAYLAATTDSGGIYVLDLSSKNVSSLKMKTSHNSIAWAAAFIPDRSSELITSGYDCSLLLHDFRLGTLLAKIEFTSLPALAPGISSLPPFITAVTLSSSGTIASGTADGRIWIGFGGAKLSTSSGSGTGKKGKAKKTRKWGGLNEEEGFFTKVSDSLIADLKFVSVDSLIACTVHGRLSKHRLVFPSSSGSSNKGGLLEEWSTQITSYTRIDALAYNLNEDRIATAGLYVDQKRGVVELRSLRAASTGSVEGSENAQ